MTFPNAIQRDRGEPSKVRIGTVADGQFVLQETALDPDSVGVLSSYSPVNGDSVALLGQSSVGTSGTSWLALGRVVPADAPGVRTVRAVAAGDLIASGVVDPVNFSFASYDTDGFWDAADPDHITIPFDGIFAFTWWLVFDPTALGGLRYIEINQNGTRRATHRHLPVTSDHNDLSTATEFECVAGDVINFAAFQNTGAGLTILDAVATVRFVGTLGS